MRIMYVHSNYCVCTRARVYVRVYSNKYKLFYFLTEDVEIFLLVN